MVSRVTGSTVSLVGKRTICVEATMPVTMCFKGQSAIVIIYVGEA